jgi:UDP-3-O-[3-hydroxymyristoyl] N-acetylglucosamine deacetylase
MKPVTDGTIGAVGVGAAITWHAEDDASMELQRTLARRAECEGVGLHSGLMARLRILPAAAGAGIVFVRTDRGGAEIPASWRLLNGTSLATALSRGAVTVATVEHVLSALHGLGIDNARIEIDGPEVPILDGSAAPFVTLIRDAGIRALDRPRRFLMLNRPVRVRDGGKVILALPANDLRATYAIDFPHPAIGYQAVDGTIDERTYADSIAPARTFCLLRDVEAMRRAGLARGGSLENAVVVGDQGVLNGALRLPDEFVRHKVLDLVGDLALLGAPVRAHVLAFKGGHRLHAALVRRIMTGRAAWSIRTSDERLPAAALDAWAHLKDALLPRPAPAAG